MRRRRTAPGRWSGMRLHQSRRPHPSPSPLDPLPGLVRCITPGRVVPPDPPTRLDPDPATVPIGFPVGPDDGGKPHGSELRMLLPTPMLVQAFGSDQLNADLRFRASLGWPGRWGSWIDRGAQGHRTALDTSARGDDLTLRQADRWSRHHQNADRQADAPPLEPIAWIRVSPHVLHPLQSTTFAEPRRMTCGLRLNRRRLVPRDPGTGCRCSRIA